MNVYEAFTKEVDALPIKAEFTAVHTVGILTRAVKRAQMVVDGELPAIEKRLDKVQDYIK